MSETIAVRPVGLADIEMMGLWLIPRLQTAYPNASPAMIKSALVQAISNQGQWMARGDHVAAMAYLQPGFLGEPAVVQMAFAVGERGEDDQEEVWALFLEVVRWAKRQGVGGIALTKHSDVRRDTMRSRINKYGDGLTWYWPRTEHSR